MKPHQDIEGRNICHRFEQVIVGTTASALCLIMLAACSSPFTVNSATDAAAADKTDTSISTSNSKDSDGPKEPSIEVKRFVSCLTSKGFDARSVGWDNNQVGVVELDAAGNPAQSEIRYLEDGTEEHYHTTPPELYPNVKSSGGIGNSITKEDWNYVIFRTSTDMAGSPYASKQADYAACETAVPDFSQSTFSATDQDANASEEDKAAVLKYAQDARTKGFSWIADPSGEHPLTIVIPNTVPEEDVRRFFQECPANDTPVIFGWIGDYPYDTFAVQQAAP
ncbi:hypothetical protein [Bifidobacterium olomucense]|uniref:Uridine kinase n=1 Tax=Bifidobacterium olomucense TaxID=2675324 RepID=A0A7Y0EWW5_9BIFI|nr:hypothetical protein [Bifidobacterium sp. DSM 109959]NMM97919.1 hypothetical protein [Bifidobacterium sp. DSM 109959]